MQVNTEQWLSNEKAQKGLLLPAWVPSKLPITATSPLSDMPRPDGDTALGTIPSATESRASVPQAGAEEGWLSPERAVKSLLVPSWVPSKLPIGASPPAPEGSSQVTRHASAFSGPSISQGRAFVVLLQLLLNQED